MTVNMQASHNFFAQVLIVFLIIEGLKIFPFIAHASRGSLVFKISLNVVVNFAFSMLVRGSGGEMFLGEGITPLLWNVAAGTLATAGLHRLKKAFERRSPSNHLWEAKPAPPWKK